MQARFESEPLLMSSPASMPKLEASQVLPLEPKAEPELPEGRAPPWASPKELLLKTLRLMLFSLAKCRAFARWTKKKKQKLLKMPLQ